MKGGTAIEKRSTYKPKHEWRTGTFRGDKRQTMCKYAHETLGAGDVEKAIKLPKGEDEDEWLAMHVVDFYNETSMLYSTIMDKCSCPKMSAGKKYEYLWADTKTKKPQKVSAPKYVDLLMTWIEDQLNDEKIFPTRVDCAFPEGFKKIVQKIMQRLFRVYAHIYHEHFRDILALNAPAHLNSALKRFVLFCYEFSLLKPRDTAPLKDLIEKKLMIKDGHYRGKKTKPQTPSYMLSAKLPAKAKKEEKGSVKPSRSPAEKSKPAPLSTPEKGENPEGSSGGKLCLVM